jgi:hypothetical protein
MSNAARDARRAASRTGRTCRCCGTPIASRRSTRRTCSDLCRAVAWRRRRRPVAHQRRLRDRLTRTQPRPVAASLAGYSVALIDRLEALPLIRRYEWLRNLGQAHTFVGLLSPAGELQGVAAFGPGPAGRIRDIIGGPALCLERGCCVHYAPRNAASFLIARATKLIRRREGDRPVLRLLRPERGRIRRGLPSSQLDVSRTGDEPRVSTPHTPLCPAARW